MQREWIIVTSRGSSRRDGFSKLEQLFHFVYIKNLPKLLPLETDFAFLSGGCRASAMMPLRGGQLIMARSTRVLLRD